MLRRKSAVRVRPAKARGDAVCTEIEDVVPLYRFQNILSPPFCVYDRSVDTTATVTPTCVALQNDVLADQLVSARCSNGSLVVSC